MNNDAAGSNIQSKEKKISTLPMMFTNYAKVTSGKTPKSLLEYSEIVADKLGKQYNNNKAATCNADKAAAGH